MEIKKYIQPLNMNGLRGRMLKISSKNKVSNTEILYVPGHRDKLEKLHRSVEYFRQYGNLTIPDLPGFGGMKPFDKIGEKPTLSNYTDYLAAFIKLSYKRKKVLIVASSFAVPIVIKMLQKYPELQNRVISVVSLSGFVHYEDYAFTRKELRLMRFTLNIWSKKLPANTFVRIFPKKSMLTNFLGLSHDESGSVEHIKLWKNNDFRTVIYLYYQLLYLDLCDGKLKVKMYHFVNENNGFLNKKVVDQHMQIIFDKYQSLDSELNEYDLPKSLTKIMNLHKS